MLHHQFSFLYCPVAFTEPNRATQRGLRTLLQILLEIPFIYSIYTLTYGYFYIYIFYTAKHLYIYNTVWFEKSYGSDMVLLH